jgi:aminoglycoside phosphotransferase (APT) family kinase protein
LWAALNALREVDLPVPRPTLVDEGALIGVPVLVMTHCDGELRPPPAEPAAWIDTYAGALAAIHDTDLAHVAGLTRCRELAAALERIEERPPDSDLRTSWEDVVAALRRQAGGVREVDAVLRHSDMWFGNTLWTADRVTALLDWGDACIGDPRVDLGYSRLDVHLALGPEAAEAFRGSYERRRGVMPDLACFDLLATVPGLIYLPDWVDGYREVGLTYFSLALARDRLLAFVSEAMSRLGESAPRVNAARAR